MSASEPTILIIIGITGDLSRRKLLPAIEQIIKAGAAPKQFKIIGVTRRAVTKEEVLDNVKQATVFLRENLEMCQMNLAKPADYQILGNHIKSMEKKIGVPAQRLFYLSVPPQSSQQIVQLLGKSGLSKGRSKLLLEKPFGTDLFSAQDLIEHVGQYFNEDQVYRIDHYLAKEMAQNLIVFRQDNSLFRRTWNKDFIDNIAIIASEKIGIEGRATFYEQTGALRDIVQSHLLQLASLTLMEVLLEDSLKEIPARRAKALRNLQLPGDKPVSAVVKRGQYKGYQQEVNNPHSTVETYVNMTLQSNDPNWAGVPITISTGKALPEKYTEIRLRYKKDALRKANELRIKLQPKEGIELYLWAKVPGYEWKVEQHSLHLQFREQFGDLPEAYEQVLVDAINSNHTLFTSSQEVLESWRIIQPVQDAWSMSSDDLVTYEPGTEPNDKNRI